MKKELEKRLKFENEILEIIDNQNQYTRSDLQGIVEALVMKIMQTGAIIFKEELKEDLKEKFDEHDLDKIF